VRRGPPRKATTLADPAVESNGHLGHVDGAKVVTGPDVPS